MKKIILFEYLVYLLEQWKQEKHPNNTETFTKSKLQKILFLVASVNATEGSHPLLDVFNNFYALPFGPVELDIYETMNANTFSHIRFEGNNCKHSLKEDDFGTLEESLKKDMKESIETLKTQGVDYITTPVSELVEITQKWTSWQVAMSAAEMLGSKRESMSTEDIYGSTVKAFK